MCWSSLSEYMFNNVTFCILASIAVEVSRSTRWDYVLILCVICGGKAEPQHTYC